MFEKGHDLEVKEGEYLPLSEEDIKGYVDVKLVDIIRRVELSGGESDSVGTSENLYGSRFVTRAVEGIGPFGDGQGVKDSMIGGAIDTQGVRDEYRRV